MRIGRTQSERYTEVFASTGYLPMAIEKLTTLRGLSVRPIKRADVDGLVRLHIEFEINQPMTKHFRTLGTFIGNVLGSLFKKPATIKYP